MIRKISGKTKSPSYTHLNHPAAETKSTSKFDIAETLGETFLNNSCSRNYSEKFQKVKAEQEKIKLNFKSANTEEYNNLFNIDELLDAINNHMILKLDLMKCIIKCLNISQRVPSKLF